MALPNDKISTTLVANTLGTSSRDVGTLCTHQAINKWSKWKPVRQPYAAAPTGTDWWKSVNNNCGLDIPFFNSVSALLNYYKTSPEIWAYQRPTGGATSPYRLGDFRGYDHTVTSPILTQNINNSYYKTQTYINLGVNISPAVSTRVSLNDIIPVGGFDLNTGYFGALININGTSTTKFLTDSITVDSGGTVLVPTSEFVAGNYNIGLFLTNTKRTNINDTSSIPSGTLFCPVPNGFKLISLLNSRVVVVFSGVKKPRGVDWNLQLQNVGDTSITINSIVLTIRYADKLENDPMESDEKTINVGNITIAGNSTQTRSGTSAGALIDFVVRGGYVRFTNSSFPFLNRNEPIT